MPGSVVNLHDYTVLYNKKHFVKYKRWSCFGDYTVLTQLQLCCTCVCVFQVMSRPEICSVVNHVYSYIVQIYLFSTYIIVL